MARPIFLIGFPLEADNVAVQQVQMDLSSKLEGEYHVIVYKVPGITSIDFKVLNAINASDIELEELIEKTKSFTKMMLEEYHAELTNSLTEHLEKNKNNPEQNGKV